MFLYCTISTLGVNYPTSGAGSTGQVLPARTHGVNYSVDLNIFSSSLR